MQRIKRTTPTHRSHGRRACGPVKASIKQLNQLRKELGNDIKPAAVDILLEILAVEPEVKRKDSDASSAASPATIPDATPAARPAAAPANAERIIGDLKLHIEEKTNVLKQRINILIAVVVVAAAFRIVASPFTSSVIFEFLK